VVDSSAADVSDVVTQSPLLRLEQALHPWIVFAVVPLFAFTNAGLALGGLRVADLASPLPLGIALGLVLGKPLGVVTMALLLGALRIAPLPIGMDRRALLGVGLLCGIGFTMSLFFGSLAFAQAPGFYRDSVLGILLASLIAAIAGYTWLWAVLPRRAGS